MSLPDALADGARAPLGAPEDAPRGLAAVHVRLSAIEGELEGLKADVGHLVGIATRVETALEAFRQGIAKSKLARTLLGGD